MIRQLPTGFTTATAERVASITIPAGLPVRPFDHSTIIRAFAEQLPPISGPAVFPDALSRQRAQDIVGSGWTPDRFGGSDTALLASRVDFGALLDFPDWTAQVFIYAGLCLLVLGVMAWLGSYGLQRRVWGRRLTLSGAGLFVVGSAWSTFLALLRYVLG